MTPVWAHVDEDRIISEGFRGDWCKADIRYEHEAQGCEVAKRVLPGLGYSDEFITKVNAIIDGHDTRQEAHSIEDALMRDADRSWRFERVGISLASGWFGQTPDYYTDRLDTKSSRNSLPKQPSPWPMLPCNVPETY